MNELVLSLFLAIFLTLISFLKKKRFFSKAEFTPLNEVDEKLMLAAKLIERTIWETRTKLAIPPEIMKGLRDIEK